MKYKRGDVVLIKFPFTSLVKSKKRPVLVMKDENEYGDFICFQITSQSSQNNIHSIGENDIFDGDLKLESYVKYDKCFTLNSKIVEKKLVSLQMNFLEIIKSLFCENI